MEKWGLLFGKLVPKVKPKDQIKTWRILRGDIVRRNYFNTAVVFTCAFIIRLGASD